MHKTAKTHNKRIIIIVQFKTDLRNKFNLYRTQHIHYDESKESSCSEQDVRIRIHLMCSDSEIPIGLF